VLALRFDWRNNSILTLRNFNGKPQDVVIAVHADRGKPPCEFARERPQQGFRGHQTSHRA
jgi:hypothetical protein